MFILLGKSFSLDGIHAFRRELGLSLITFLHHAICSAKGTHFTNKENNNEKQTIHY